MDPSRFDGLARGIAGFTSRRATLAGLLAGLAAPLLGEGEMAARKQRNKHRHGQGRDHGARAKQGHAGHGVDAEKKKKKKKCKHGTTKCGKHCLNLQTDRANCGACGKACPSGVACVTGACATPPKCGAGAACGNGQTCCAGACFDLNASDLHCGSCANACDAGEQCNAGVCLCGNVECASDETCCGDVCVATATDFANCGACGNDCGSGEVCDGGVCLCGGGACGGNETCCGGTACVDTQTSFTNCDGCGFACDNLKADSCVGGACKCGQFDPCAGNEQCCGGQCVNITTVQNCGACGHVCPGYMQPNDNVTCDNGATCTFSCQGDSYDVDGDPSNGCEQIYTGGAHLQGNATPLGDMSSCAGSRETSVSTIYSDTRVHTNPAVAAFNTATGSAPQWWVVTATGGACNNDLDVTLTMTGATGNCYKLTVITDKSGGGWSAQTSGGVANIHQDGSAYSDATPVYFTVEKTCGTSVREAASYTITYHL